MPHHIITLKSGTTGIDKSKFIATMSLASSGGGVEFPNRHVKIINSMSFSNINMIYSMSIAESTTLKGEKRVRFISLAPRTSSRPDMVDFDFTRNGHKNSLKKWHFTASAASSSMGPGQINLGGKLSGSSYFTQEGYTTASHQWATYFRGFPPSSYLGSSSISAQKGYEFFNQYHNRVNSNIGNWGLLRHNQKESNPLQTDQYIPHNITDPGGTDDYQSQLNNSQGTTRITHSFTNFIRPSAVSGVYSTDHGANKPFEYHLDGTGVDIIISEFSSFSTVSSDMLDEKGNSRAININWLTELGIPEAEWPNNYITPSPWTGLIAEVRRANGTNASAGSGGGYHMTACASAAGGRWSSFGKGAHIYGYKRTMFSDNEIYTPDGVVDASMVGLLSQMQAFANIRRFHESKSIDPATGFKRPTVISDSTGFNMSVFRPSELANSNKSEISKIYYSGSLYDHTSSSIAHQGGTVTVSTHGVNDMHAKLEFGLTQYPSDWTGSAVFESPNAPTALGCNGWGHDKFPQQFLFLVAEMEELCKIPGVLYLKAAGNDNNISHRAPQDPSEDEANGVRTEAVMPGYRSLHYNNHFIYASASDYSPANEPVHYSRTEGCTDTIIVGTIETDKIPHNPNYLWGHDGTKNFPDNLKFEVPSEYTNKPCDVYAASSFLVGSSLQKPSHRSGSIIVNPSFNTVSSSLYKTALGLTGYNRHLADTTPYTYRGGPYSNMNFNHVYISSSHPLLNTHVVKTPSGFTTTGSSNLEGLGFIRFWKSYPLFVPGPSMRSTDGISNPHKMQTSSMFFNGEFPFRFDGNPINDGFPTTGRSMRGLTNYNEANGVYPFLVRGDNYFTYLTGTSFSCPLMAGLAACYLQVNPMATSVDFKKWMQYHGDTLSTTQSLCNVPEDSWSYMNNGIFGKTLPNFGQPRRAGNPHNYSHYVEGIDSGSFVTIPTSSRPMVPTKATQSVAYQPYNSPFKNKFKATFKRK